MLRHGGAARLVSRRATPAALRRGLPVQAVRAFSSEKILCAPMVYISGACRRRSVPVAASLPALASEPRLRLALRV